MNPNRWREIEALFDECSALDPAERVAWLEAQGARDPELRREVEALLGYDEPSERLERIVQRSQEEVFLAGEERPGAGSSSGLGLVGARGGDGLGPGDTVGAYRLERRLGEGGMGTVWLAHRDDDEFEQRVALKLVGSGGEARGWVERFRTERQILAGLEHPHIARLLDGGSTEGGQPFLVMEYVDGEELLAYCDRRKLGIHPRLELFLQVLGAVEHAHRNLVVHRDLKPANILVHAESGPKLLDFGIAKILDPEPAGGLDGRLRADPTLPQERLLTPDYASPEQILGGAVTTASDLYSLGVVLFELLTGRRPRRLQGLGPVAVERELTERPPSRPSTVARSATGPGAGRGLGLAEAETNAGDLAELRGLSARQLARQLRGDLDTVVVKALQTDPARRYRSVAELADDLERHLGGRPVRARPDSWHYRAGKLLRRHPWGVAATVAIAGLLVAFVVNLVLQSERLRSERDRARAAEAEARGVSEFLLDIFRVADPGESRGETVTARELLDRGGELIETELHDQPAAQAALLTTLADVHRNLGLQKRAAELHAQALERRLELFGPKSLEAAESQDRLGDTDRLIGRLDEAETLLRQSLATREALLPPDDPAVADSLNNLGLLFSETGRPGEAEPLLRRGLEIRLDRLGPDDPETLVSRSNLGQLLMNQRRYPEAEAQLREAADRRLALYGERHPKVAHSFQTLATLLDREERDAEAEELFERSIRIFREVLPGDHPFVASALSNLASLYQDQGRHAEAEPLYREALDIDRATGSAGALPFAYSLNNLGSLLEDQGRYGEAEELYEQSLALRRQLLGDDNASVAGMKARMGRLAVYAGDLATAKRRLDEAWAWQDPHLPPDDLARASTLTYRGDLARATGDLATSETLLREALDIYRQALPATSPTLGLAQTELAWTLALSSEPARCQPLLDAARPLLDHQDAPPQHRARLLLAAGFYEAAQGQTKQAQADFQAAIDLLDPTLGPQNYWARVAETEQARLRR